MPLAMAEGELAVVEANPGYAATDKPQATASLWRNHGALYPKMSGTVAKVATFTCTDIHPFDFKTGAVDAGRTITVTETVGVLNLCTTGCMNDVARQICCAVPFAISAYFPCCRVLACCPDQLMGGNGRRRSLQVCNTWQIIGSQL